MYISLSDRPEDSEGLAGSPPPPFRISRVIVSLGVVSLFTDISSESVAAILPLYLTGALGLSLVAYGFLDGIYQGASALVRIGSGWAADSSDRPKLVALLGYGLSAAARIGLLLFTGFAAITAIIGIDRVGKGIRTAPRDAMITAVAQPEHLARSFGVHRMLDTVGATLGPLIAFLVLLVIPTGYSTVFVVSLAFAALGLAVLLILVPNVRSRATASARPEPPGRRRPKRIDWRALSTPRLRRLLIVAGLFGLLTVGDGFIYLVLQSRNEFAVAGFPLLYVGTNLVFLLLAVPFGRLADRFGRTRMFVLGHGALLAAYLCAVLPSIGLTSTILCLVLLGAFYAATDGVLAALAGQFSPPQSTASGIAAVQTVVAVTRLVASTGFGLLWFTIGRENAVLLVAGALVLGIGCAVVILRGANGMGRKGAS